MKPFFSGTAEELDVRTRERDALAADLKRDGRLRESHADLLERCRGMRSQAEGLQKEKESLEAELESFRKKVAPTKPYFRTPKLQCPVVSRRDHVKYRDPGGPSRLGLGLRQARARIE